MTDFVALVLAAGKGTRMYSELPKVLHPLVGLPMVKHVLAAVQQAGIEEQVIVVGHEAELVEQTLGMKFKYAHQEQQLGTGHAVMVAGGVIPDSTRNLVVLCGDTPLLTETTLRRLLEEHATTEAAATVLTAVVEDPDGYGRIIRDSGGTVQSIVEDRDATSEQRKIKEINTGTYCFDYRQLVAALKKIQPANAQGEYYLTDVLGLVSKGGQKIAAVMAGDSVETAGINNRLQLARAEKVLRERINRDWMLQGVTMVDPEHTYIETEVIIARDTVLYPGTVLQGRTVIGQGCLLGPETIIKDCQLGDNVEVIKSVLLESQIGSRCKIGPFSYLRPGTELYEDVKVGDFVEIKKTTVGEGSKVPHLTYLGDCTVGSGVNIGAGTITCNYDGEKKWPTVIEDNAFIGSNANLVAPVKVGRGAIIGAGSTITKDVPAESLGLGRGKQVNVVGWRKKGS